MSLEDLTGTKKLDALVPANPAGLDARSEGDDHLRGIKNVLLNTFGAMDTAPGPAGTVLTSDGAKYAPSALPAVIYPQGHIAGLLSNPNGSDPANDLFIGAGQATAISGDEMMLLSSSIVKRSQLAWAVGTNQGSLDTGVVANADYHIHLIKRPDTGVVDVLTSLSATAPVLPANYTKFRLIGWFRRTAGAIIDFYTYLGAGGGLDWYWRTPIMDFLGAHAGARRENTINVPLQFGVIARCNFYMQHSAAQRCWVRSPQAANLTPSINAVPLANLTTEIAQGGTALEIMVQTFLGIIATTCVSATDTVNCCTQGFFWARRN